MESSPVGVKLQIWDTAGPERYRSISSAYYRGMSGYFMFFDVSDRGSLANVPRWVSEMRRYGREDTPAVLIGMKQDIAWQGETAASRLRSGGKDAAIAANTSADPGEGNGYYSDSYRAHREQCRQVSYDEGLAMAQQFDMPYVECSAKDNVHIEDALATLVYHIIRSRADLQRGVQEDVFGRLLGPRGNVATDACRYFDMEAPNIVADFHDAANRYGLTGRATFDEDRWADRRRHQCPTVFGLPSLVSKPFWSVEELGRSIDAEVVRAMSAEYHRHRHVLRVESVAQDVETGRWEAACLMTEGRWEFAPSSSAAREMFAVTASVLASLDVFETGLGAVGVEELPTKTLNALKIANAALDRHEHDATAPATRVVSPREVFVSRPDSGEPYAGHPRAAEYAKGLAQLADDPNRQYHFLLKLLMVGDGGVGKSSYLQRLANSRFTHEYTPTLGLDFGLLRRGFCDPVLPLSMESSPVHIALQIWDTAGEERFRTMTSLFCRGASGYFVFFDVSYRGSFESIPRWVGEMRENGCGDVPAVLIGMKQDIAWPDETAASRVRSGGKDAATAATAGDVNGVYRYREQCRQVSYDEGLAMAQQFDMPYVECSAKDNVHIEDALATLVYHIMRSRADLQHGVPETLVTRPLRPRGNGGKREAVESRRQCVVS
eukprot:gene14910-biopygen6746